MLDSRVRCILEDYLARRCDLETAARSLLEVRRATGCLELRATETSSEPQRLLVIRHNELVREMLGE